jgi:signal transduction histidine kinase
MNPACRGLLDNAGIPHDQIARILPQHYERILGSAQRDPDGVDLDEKREGRFLRFLFRAAGDQEHVYIFIVDLTREEEARAQLSQNEKMASLGLLIAGLAHEINTPLGAIHSNNDIVARSAEKLKHSLPGGGPLDPATARVVGVLEEACRNSAMATDRLIGIVSSLKNFARVDESERKRVDVHEGIDSTLVLVQHQFKNRIDVLKDYGELPQVECFPNRLNQVFMNLLVNAGQAIRERGTIRIRTRQVGDAVQVDIADTGVGIPAENLPKIFDPGFTTKGVGIGTGLGLSISYRIIQEHRGTIDVHSGPEGTTFTIRLPLQTEPR